MVLYYWWKSTFDIYGMKGFTGAFILIDIHTICYRKVLREAASGGRDAERVKLKLEIKVEVRLQN